MKKRNILIAMAMGLMLALSAFNLSAQQLTTYTPSLEMVSSAAKAGQTVFVYRLTGDATERTQYAQWLREMKHDPSVITAFEVDGANTQLTVTMAGVASAERGQHMLQDYDRVLRMREAALNGPNAAAERKLQEEFARNASSVPSQH